MSNRKIHRERCVLTRGELAAELHRLASRLETGRDLEYGSGDAAVTLAVPHQIHHELEVKRTKDGELKVEIEFDWPANDQLGAIDHTAGAPREVPGRA